LKILLGIATLRGKKITKEERDFIAYFTRLIIFHMIEIFTFKETKYDIKPESVIIELESDNSDNKLYS